MVLSSLKNLPRDFKFVSRVLKAKHEFKLAERNNLTVGSVFDSLSKKHPDKVCFYFGDQVWTYKQIEQASNRIGNYFANQGLRKNDVVSLFMDNRIEFVVTWLGLSKIGVVPALLNCNLRSIPLKHSVELIKPKAIICGYELSSPLEEIYPKGETGIPVFGTGDGDRGILSKAIDIDKNLSTTSDMTPVPAEQINWNDDLFYIYTSGTTGLPKAAIFKQSRFVPVVQALSNLTGMNQDDTVYTTFPLHHTAGGIIAVGFGICRGIPVVIRNKFSATNFWKDCVRYNVTAAQYMGEICRYLLKQPPTPEEKQHKLRMMFGNGLRPEIWNEFKERFNIPLISEMYGATEGNSNLFNFVGKHGAVGFIPPLFQPFFPVNIIKLDEDEEPIRDPKTGLAIKAKSGELGELVGLIQDGEPGREFKGYAGDENATNKKIVNDVFKKGDKAFRSGDMFRRDAEGYYYFKDRIGDTFRWKAENVSTAQVEYVISTLLKLDDVVVFGVQIPNCDGRAGMATIADPNNRLNLDELAKGLIKSLPSFARPLFLRVCKEIELTGTYKMKKYPLQKAGIDLKEIGNDQIYFFDTDKFIPLTKDLHEQIISGQIKL